MGAGTTARGESVRLGGRHRDDDVKDRSRRMVEHVDARGRLRKRSMAATAHASKQVGRCQ